MGHHHSEHQFNYIIPTDDHSTELGHIVPFRVYLGVFLSLLVLTVLTVVVSRFDFGSFNIVVAMVVASIKACLVACFFMHLKFENKFTLGYAAFPFVLLALLMGGVFIDNPFRASENGISAIEEYSGGRIDHSKTDQGSAVAHH
jgi:cytochrome c oxidase subunit 4